MKYINLAYWQEKNGNYGDELSPYIISKLSTEKLNYKKYIYHGLKPFLKFLYWNFKEKRFFSVDSIAFPFEKTLVAIGSLLGQTNRNCYIWGTGFMNETDIFHGGKISAVRGPLSNCKIIKSGFCGTEVYGDPALLLPLVYPCSIHKHNDLGLIPHMFETDYFIEKYSTLYKIIDLRSHDIEKITDDITSCRFILSSSLHGIIVSHAYGIPALWIKKSYVNTDGFKFKDYFSSVNIDQYDGFTDRDIPLDDYDSVTSFFLRNKKLSLPNMDISKIQFDLLRSAPFPLKENYKDLINDYVS